MGDYYDTLKFILISRTTNKTEQSRGGSTDAAGLIDAQEVLTQFGNHGAKAPGKRKGKDGQGTSKEGSVKSGYLISAKGDSQQNVNVSVGDADVHDTEQTSARGCGLSTVWRKKTGCILIKRKSSESRRGGLFHGIQTIANRTSRCLQ